MRSYSLSLALLLSTTSLGWAQELPTDEQLRDQVTTSLPGYWSLEAFRVVASALQGDPIAPQALVRFEADIMPVSGLYSATGERAGPFVLVVPTYEAEQARTLYGTMQLDYRAGQWSGAPQIENPIDNLGRPLDLFSSPTLVLGSEEQTELMTALRDNTVSNAVAQMEAELSGLQAEHQQRVAALQASLTGQRERLEAEQQAVSEAHEARLASLEMELQARLAELQDSFEPEIASEERRLAEALSEFQAEHNERMKALQAAQEEEIAGLESAHRTRLRSLRAQQAEVTADLEETLAEAQAGHVERVRALQAAQEEEIAGLEATHAARLGSLRAQQAEVIAELEEGFSARRERLERQLAEASAIVEVQEETIEIIQQTLDNDVYMLELTAQRKDEQLALLESFGSVLPGVVECRWQPDRRSSETLSTGGPLVFRTKDVLPTGIIGLIEFDGNVYDAILAFDGETDQIPLQMELSVAVPKDGSGAPHVSTMLSNYSLSVDSRGVLQGPSVGNQMTTRLDRGDNLVAAQCSMVLGG